MKKLLIIFIGLVFFGSITAQTHTVKQLQENAKVFMQQGDFDNAVASLLKARQTDPLNMELLKNLSFAYFLQRDFAKAIETGKIVIEMDDADQQAFQILGLSYKSIASYKEANKLYKVALNKFPKGGVMYNEYGESLALEKNTKEAIIQWEKGIELDPNFSGNYYNAIKFYSDQQNYIRIILYGELFVNLESYSVKTNEVKNTLLVAYKNLFKADNKKLQLSATELSLFEQKVIAIFKEVNSNTTNLTSAEQLTEVKQLFLAKWFTNGSISFPYRLFDHWQYLATKNMLSAYNQWLLANAFSENAFSVWQQNHVDEFNQFQLFQQSRVFKISEAQYYSK